VGKITDPQALFGKSSLLMALQAFISLVATDALVGGIFSALTSALTSFVTGPVWEVLSDIGIGLGFDSRLALSVAGEYHGSTTSQVTDTGKATWTFGIATQLRAKATLAIPGIGNAESVLMTVMKKSLSVGKLTDDDVEIKLFCLDAEDMTDELCGEEQTVCSDVQELKCCRCGGGNSLEVASAPNNFEMWCKDFSGVAPLISRPASVNVPCDTSEQCGNAEDSPSGKQSKSVCRIKKGAGVCSLCPDSPCVPAVTVMFHSGCMEGTTCEGAKGEKVCVRK